MRVFELTGGFGLECLRPGRREPRSPGPGEVRLRVLSASLNYRDLLMVRGQYNPRQPLPLIPASDGVGEVMEVGPNVAGIAAGDRVAPIFAQGWLDGDPDRDLRRTTLGGPLDGTLAEETTLNATGVVPVPAHLSDDEAATLTCAGLTAWNAVVGDEPVRAGETVLVLGTGGVALFALQFARAQGARVIVTSSSDAKLERATTLGAWATLNYVDRPEWGRAVRDMTGGRGVDRIVEVGGAATLPQSMRAIRMGGRIALIGSLTGGSTQFDFIPVFMQQVRLQGLFVGHRRGFEEMNRAVEAHVIRPVIDRVFPFDETPAAFAHLESATHFGKICVRVAP
jgi:NADPH:quinone reductase-like Zn-dependent oxidoreductase